MTAFAQQDPADLAKLRELLLGDDYERVAALAREVDDPSLRAQRIAEVISEALTARGRSDGSLADALAVPVERALRASVRRDPRPLVEAVYPIMGPAIRKSVAEALATTLQRVGAALESAFTLRGLRWRWESWRTGAPYAEIALHHSLVYQVEQVFWIHRESGVLLQHVLTARGGVRDPDMVSGMLTAVREFTRDSFDAGRGAALDMLQLGELRLIIEEGPRAVLAAAVRGTPPGNLAALLRDALETLHRENREALERFDGELEPFAASRSVLERCLQGELLQPAQRSYRLTMPALLVLLVLVAAGRITWMHARNAAWDALALRLESEPGIALLASERGRNLSGLRDPLARDPATLLAEVAPGWSFEMTWKPYLSLEPEMTLRRARVRLEVPTTIGLALVGETLRATGTASPSWIDRSEREPRSLPGIASLDLSRVAVEGTAHPRELAFQRQQLESIEIYFAPFDAGLLASEAAALDRAAALVRRVQPMAASLGLSSALVITGYADLQGTVESNLELSSRRSAGVAKGLVERGVPRKLLRRRAMGSSRPVSGVRSEDSPLDRRVTFALLLEAPRGAAEVAP